jgi:Flp pilus assembly secretin CpaC
VVVHEGSVSCTNNQRIALTDFAQVSYMQDYDVEIAEGSAIGDPIVQLVNDGFMVDLHPTVAGNGDMVVLQVRTEVADLTRPVRTVQLPLGTVDLPTLEVLKMRTTAAVPLGRTVVVGGALSDGDDDALLVLITPTATRYGRR